MKEEEMHSGEELKIQIKEMLETLLDAILQIHDDLLEKKWEEFELLAKDLKIMLECIITAIQQKEETIFQELKINCENSLYSFSEIKKYAKIFPQKAVDKIAFELWGMLRITYIRFYYFALLYPNKEKRNYFWEQEAQGLCKNYFIEKAEKKNEYLYDISIYVVAYNKLWYTKKCIEAIIESFPKNLKCELILVNHGSLDGTKEYFESIKPNKQIDIKVNGVFGFFVPQFAIQGKYFLNISNDVIITEKSIEIMYQCLENNKKIGVVVPVTPNISNLQSVPAKEIEYSNIEELKQRVCFYNHSEKRQEEQRTRLCIPLFMGRSFEYMNGIGKIFANIVLSRQKFFFGDDLLSLYYRRAGYECILMKDIYCHHFGSITAKEEENTKIYLEGRKVFYEETGVDPWERGNWWSYPLFKEKICNKVNASTILGINCGVGSNSLKIKEQLKEETGNFKVRLENYTQEKRFLKDLEAISEKASIFQDWNNLFQQLQKKYDYVLLNGGLEEIENYRRIVIKLFEHLNTGGIIFVMSFLPEQIMWIKRQYTNVEVVEDTEFPTCQQNPIKCFWAYWKK